jgi:hypothetical protein
MKQELTIAFCLLAAGLTIGGWYSAGQLERYVAGSDAATEDSPTAGQKKLIEPFRRNSNARSSTQNVNYAPSDAVSSNPKVSLEAQRLVSDFRSDGTTADRADLMLRRAWHMIDDGPAFESNVSVQAKFFDQMVVGAGVYVQTGQGEGKTRTSLAFHSISSKQSTDTPTTPPQQQVTNLCDGRFVYRLHENLVQNQQTLEFYDLQKIKNSKSVRRNQSARARPSMPLAPGELMSSGMAGLLQHLADEFRFAVVADSEAPSTTSKVLRGTWRPSRLQRLLRDHLSPEQLDAGLAWSHLPPNLPHAVEVTLISSAALDLFPSQLVFYQFQPDNDRTIAKPVVIIQFQQPATLETVSDDQFVLRSDNLEATDLTQQYLSKLRPDEDHSLR